MTADQLIASIAVHPMCSGCLTVIIVPHPAQPLSAPDGPTRFNLGLARNDQPVPPSLVVPFQVIMRNEFMNGLTQRALIPSGLGSRLLSTDIRLKSKRRFRLRFKASFPEADGQREEVNRPRSEEHSSELQSPMYL